MVLADFGPRELILKMLGKNRWKNEATCSKWKEVGLGRKYLFEPKGRDHKKILASYKNHRGADRGRKAPNLKNDLEGRRLGIRNTPTTIAFALTAKSSSKNLMKIS